MDQALKTKLDDARKGLNSKQAGINANRHHGDHAKREWARGEQRPANTERAAFRRSLTDAERNQIEERIQQLVDEHPRLPPVTAKMLDGNTPPAAIPADVLDEYHFLREMVG
jgi:hypothetical protein